MSSTHNRDWLADFLHRHGRRPRLLHIGNIANNAYNNAKLLIAAGFNCDVVCYDYYHIMGCPEWEDADFDGDHGDDFYPDWARVDLHGFRRPDWFVQGPQAVCLAYLNARFGGDTPATARLRNKLERSKRSHARHRLYAWRRRLLVSRPLAPALVLYRNARHALRLVARLLRPTRVSPDCAAFDARVHKLLALFARTFPARTDKLQASDFDHLRPTFPAWRRLLANYDLIIAYSTDPILPLLCNAQPYIAFEHGTLRAIPFAADTRGRLTALAYSRADHVLVTNVDCLDNARRLAGTRVTFINHPFDEDHGAGIDAWQTLRADLCARLDADFIVFFPTRHDWVAGRGYADKGNDIFLRAFVRLRQSGRRLGLVCCRWGANVAESAALLADAGYAAHVHWTAPLGTVMFEKTALACDLIADQFKLGSFGGVFFKAMAVGRPVCTYLDPTLLATQFPTPPPVLNCRSTDEIVSRLAALLDQSDTVTALGLASRAWIKANHAGAATVAAQLGVIAPLLSARPRP
jgi:glycosyltransferase involved in cell wall biosynthesis